MGTRIEILNEFYVRYARLMNVVGPMNITAARVTRMVAEAVFSDQTWATGTCPGYGETHLRVGDTSLGISGNRCREHPERRQSERILPAAESNRRAPSIPETKPSHAERHVLDAGGMKGEDFEVARSLHRVVRAMHDGECPRCHAVYPAPAMRDLAGGMCCPNCGFRITDDEARAAVDTFAPVMEKNLEVFEAWRASRITWQ